MINDDFEIDKRITMHSASGPFEIFLQSVIIYLDVGLHSLSLQSPHVVLEPQGEGGGQVGHGPDGSSLLHHSAGHHVDLGVVGGLH